jgi:hypothetical protein
MIFYFIIFVLQFLFAFKHDVKDRSFFVRLDGKFARGAGQNREQHDTSVNTEINLALRNTTAVTSSWAGCRPPPALWHGDGPAHKSLFVCMIATHHKPTGAPFIQQEGVDLLPRFYLKTLSVPAGRLTLKGMLDARMLLRPAGRGVLHSPVSDTECRGDRGLGTSISTG